MKFYKYENLPVKLWMDVVMYHFKGIKLLAVKEHCTLNLNEKSLYKNYKIEF